MNNGDYMYTLYDLPPGCTAKVCLLTFSGKERRRMLDLGLTSGTDVTTEFFSPAGDPVAYLVRGTIIALRNQDAKKILIN